MSFGKKVVVAFDLNDSSAKQLKELGQLEFLKDAEVHLVHVYQTTIMTYGLGEFCQIYPAEPDRGEIERSITSTITRLLPDHSSSLKIRCLFDENPKEEFCLYAKEVKADTVIIFTRERHGIFESSFAQYAARHCQCHVLIMRP